MDMTLCISRRSDDKIVISIEDEASRTEFVEVKLSPHDFAMAVTGLSFVKVTGSVRGLENVGKKKVTEKRSVVCPLDSYDKKDLSAWLEQNCSEQGWLLNTYLGSQGSVEYVDGGRKLNYSVYKYEPA